MNRHAKQIDGNHMRHTLRLLYRNFKTVSLKLLLHNNEKELHKHPLFTNMKWSLRHQPEI